MLIAEDLAYGDMSLAIAALSSLSFVNTVIDAGSPAQQQALLPAFTADAPPAATVAFMEPGIRFNAQKPKTTARKSGGGYVLDGVKTMVPLGLSAKHLLVVADEEGAGPAAFVIEQGQAGVRAEREHYMGLRPLELAEAHARGRQGRRGEQARRGEASTSIASSTCRASASRRCRSASGRRSSTT